MSSLGRLGTQSAWKANATEGEEKASRVVLQGVRQLEGSVHSEQHMWPTPATSHLLIHTQGVDIDRRMLDFPVCSCDQHSSAHLHPLIHKR